MSFEKIASFQRKCAEEDIVPEELFDLVQNLFLQRKLESPFLERDYARPSVLERFGIASRWIVFETRAHDSGSIKRTFLPQGSLQEQVAFRLRKSELEVDYFARGNEHSAQKQVGLRIEEASVSRGKPQLLVSACCRGYDDTTYVSYIDPTWRMDDGSQHERAVASILVERLTSFMDRCEMIQVDQIKF